jgi:hypothetical protein
LLQISYYSLTALAAVPVVSSFTVAYDGIIWLLCVAVGLGWLRWGGKGDAANIRVLSRGYLAVLVWLVYVFVLANAIAGEVGGRELAALSQGLVLLSAFCFWRSGLALRPLEKSDRWVLGCGVLLLLIDLRAVTDVGWGQAPGGQSGASLILGCLALHFLISRLLRAKDSLTGGHLLYLPLLAFVLSACIGCVRLGTAAYYGREAVQRFADGQYEEVRGHIERLNTSDSGLRLQPLIVDWLLGEFLDIAGDADQVQETYVLLGDLAIDNRSWSRAEEAYRRALQDTDGDPVIRVRLANALFEKGRQGESLESYAEIEGAEAEKTLAMGVALAKLGHWSEANRAFEEAFALLGSHGIVIPLPVGPTFSRHTLREITSPLLSAYLARLTLYQVVKLMEDRGWAVLHPAMEIGKTGVIAPVDIEARSGGGGTMYEERLMVGRQDWALQKRGYNVVVINPDTGEMEARENFDTWGGAGAANRLSQFLNGLPQGKIVAVTINDEGTTTMLDIHWEAMRQVGSTLRPEFWGSHAFIGVVGAELGTAAETVAQQNFIALVGALAAKIPPALEVDGEIETLLAERVLATDAGIAVYLSGLEADDTIAIVRTD